MVEKTENSMNASFRQGVRLNLNVFHFSLYVGTNNQDICKGQDDGN